MKSIISGNLNIWGNAGQFETDRSTWGFADNAIVTRSIFEFTAGNSSALIEWNNPGNSLLIPCKFLVTAGKKYILKAKVRVIGAVPIGADAALITMSASLDNLFIGSPYDLVEVTILDAKDAWLDIEASTTYASDGVFGGYMIAWIRIDGTATLGGKMYVDQFEVYEYEDVEDPCTLLIDTVSTVVTDESAPGANDGSIAVGITGGTGPFEYSNNGGSSWQSSNLFAGLGSGVYSIVVREAARIGCNSTQSFSVNDATLAFDFTATKEDESVAGASNGRIEVTVTGTGGPFTYSNNGGTTYQVFNIFTGLLPGTYTIVVKDSGGNTVAHNVSILPGLALFEKAWFSRNPIVFQKGATAGWGVLNNYRLYDDIRIEDVSGSSVFNSKMKVSLYPDAAGSVTFQVRQATRGSLVATPPAWNEKNIIRLTDRIKLFKHYTGEMQDLEVAPVTLTGSNPHLVMLGGLSKLKWASTDFFGTLMTHRKMFMTWAPRDKQVDRNQEDYLNYFVMYLLTTQLKLQVRAYFDDGTDVTSITKTKSAVSYGQLYQVPAGPSNCGALLIDPTKTVIKYDLTLLDQDNAVISEVRTYKIDQVSHPRKRLFMFLNSLGSYEVLRFTGITENTTDIAKEQVVKFLPYTYLSTDGEKEVYGARLQERSSFSSGYLDDKKSAQWLEYLKDFLLSRKVFEVTAEGERIPIVVSGGSFPTGADQDYTRFIRFTALQAYEDENYSPRDVDPEEDTTFDDTFDDTFG